MKKLMIAAAIVCAAAFAQASTVTWSLTGDILTGDPTAENYTNGDQFLVLLSTTGSTTGLGVAGLALRRRRA